MIPLDAARAELRAVAWGPLSVAAGAAALLLALDLTLWPRGPGALPGWLGAALLAGAACFAMDQPAAIVVAATPTGHARRTAVRATLGLVLVTVWMAYAVVWRSQPTVAVPLWWAQALVGCSLVLAGVGLSAVLVRRGQLEPAGGVTAGLVLSVMGLGVVPLPWRVEAFDLSGTQASTTVFWLVVAGVGLAALLWGASDRS
ncbi:hypothetical protein N802_08240 [Knoellia sinensis KCTC 19936]|uniref:ABC transporter n=1 Tax=Knoellia sinensis KCTC 19936 TaxID=1385520 RepID=A0A0A0J963_9MICO|nr:hypothetical protein [Knoellia sinensis]KGN33960.1 hypothetical protein N802_08240 [Knoellia sinensis KCTC 19936]